jgi:microcystin-dependent protein
MANPFLGEIKIVSFAFAPRNWALCDGQFLSIVQNQALFALLGTTYGGNGQTTFALPDLRARSPLHAGQSFLLGEVGGENAHTLSSAEIPAHTHPVQAVSRPGTQQSAAGNYLAAHRGGYADAPDNALNGGTLGNVGGNQAHPNMPPYLALNFVICLNGIFPSQN